MSFSGSSMNSYSRFIFFLMGAIFLAVGLGLFLFLGSVPYAGGAMQLTGGIFIVVGIIMIIAGVLAGRSASRTNQILQTGIPGTATITGMTQTGLYVNEQPQIGLNLLIQLPGEVPYAANIKQVVPLMLLGRLSSGAPLNVRVDQMDRSKVEIDWSTTGAIVPPGYAPAGYAPAGYMNPQAAAMMTQAGVQPMVAQQMAQANAAGMPVAATPMDESLAQVQAAIAGTSGGMQVANPFATAQQGQYTVEQLRAYLRQSGLEAQAHVDKLEDTGQVVGDERVYKMEMTLMIPGQSPAKLPASAAMVPVAVTHKLFQGMTLPVRYAADNHDLLMVEWNKV
jgi:hypothetical protein